MISEESTRQIVKWSGIGFVVAAVLLAASRIVMPVIPTAPDQSLELALGADSIGWRIGATLRLLSMAVEMFAAVGLFLWLVSRNSAALGTAGLALTIVGGAIFLPIVGVFLVVVPIIGQEVGSGNAEAIRVMEGYYSEPATYLPFTGAVFYLFRSIVFGIGIARTDVSWSWSGVLLIAAALINIPAFFDVAVLQIVAPMIFALALAAVGMFLWRDARRRPAMTARAPG